jgi:hypothetical protein
MKRFLVFLLFVLSISAYAAETKTFLPKIFAGWQLQSVVDQADPAKADALYATLLKEYGFSDFQTANYTKPGRTLSLKVIRFNDASGAYGAYTFYRAPEMAAESIGDQSASNNERVLFLRGNFLVDARFDHITPMSGGELRELASSLPAQTGASANLPSILNYIPKQSLVPNSVKYVSGPLGLSRVTNTLPPEQVDFSTGAEIATAQYKTSSGTADLILISYPTPAVAAIRLRSIEQWQHPATPGTNPPVVYSKRSGPVVAVLSGAISDDEAKPLLASVNYDADVTWNENTYFDKKNNIGSLLVNIIMLTVIIIGLALVAGLAFGGLRVLLRRFFPDRAIGRSDEADIIRLDIGK